jgi:flagellar protein FlgJ
MGAISTAPVFTPPQLVTAPATAGSLTELASRGRIKDAAQSFEASFLSSMLGEMFEGVDTAAPFGGGPGEAMFKSFLTDAMAHQMAKTGGVGLSSSIEREMLKLQGLK